MSKMHIKLTKALDDMQKPFSLILNYKKKWADYIDYFDIVLYTIINMLQIPIFKTMVERTIRSFKNEISIVFMIIKI